MVDPARQLKVILRPLWVRLPERTRRRLVDAKLDARGRVRHRGVRVPIERVDLGGTRSHTAASFGRGIDWPGWETTRVVDGPHADLYRRFALGEAAVNWRDPSVSYVDLARRCIAGFGEFCGCRDPDDVVELIEHRYELWLADDRQETPPVIGPALVRPIVGTDRYETVDGHHRLARAWQRGATEAVVNVTWSTSRAPGGS